MTNEKPRRNIDLWEAGKNTGERIRLFFVKSGMDMPFLIIVLLLLAIGLVSLYSASHAYAYYYHGNSSMYISRQMWFAIAGLIVMFLASTVNYHNFRKWSLPLLVYGGTLLMLIYVLFTHPESGIRRWIGVGAVSVQPSEVAKFALVLILAHRMANDSTGLTQKFGRGFGVNAAFMLLPAGLVFFEPHLSGAILLVMIGMVMMFVGGTRVSHLATIVGIGILGVVVMVWGLGYEQDRIAVWRDPIAVFESGELLANGQTGRDAAWQTVQSLYAIGSGGFMGQGLGNSRQKHLFLPEPQNDFIFSVVCEELGFVGAVVIIVLFALLVWRGFVIGMRAKDKFGSLLAIGLTAQVGLQVLLNLMVVSNLMPNTGISLPFFSYGGTSLLMLLGEMGIVLAISRQAKKER